MDSGNATLDAVPHEIVVAAVSKVHIAHIQASRTPNAPLYLPSAFSSADLSRLLPKLGATLPHEQSVALCEGTEIQRLNTSDLEWQYVANPRTRVYEGINALRSSWMASVSANLAKMSRRRVVLSLYESSAGDANSGLHYDQFDGVAVQFSGSKVWQFSDRSIETHAGDILAIPTNVGHSVRTPIKSAHLLVGYLPETLLT